VHRIGVSIRTRAWGVGALHFVRSKMVPIIENINTNHVSSP